MALQNSRALRLTDGQLTRDDPGRSGHAFYPTTLQFKNSENAKTTQSFSTRFVFEIVLELQESGGHGFTFVVAPSTNFSGAMGDRYLGLFNQGNNGNQSNHIFAVEFDTVQQATLKDKDANHVGVDVNSVISYASAPAAYYTELGRKENVILDSRTRIQAWIEYDGNEKQLNATIAPLSHPLKPNRSLISYPIDLSPVLNEHMYVGFSSGTLALASKHYILAWSFAMDGKAPELDLSSLPSIPRDRTPLWKSFKLFLSVFVALGALLLLIITVIISYWIKRKR
ncbi:L-type lectin-domain containing receptor kinase V.9-like [Nymphaea colorata]|uniref:L-type lectin-domain containing receptor kinase V.9-like n=1 Tax=Nymphaea colorata TaxID=210225 RepID=UPI00214F5EB8|nr:L-type lectin-domain containing receptor kinase V.9-like [Nymphaea colorata]